MKKVASLLLALCLAVTCALPAFAAADTSRETLEKMVETQIDNIYSNVVRVISEQVEKSVKSTLNDPDLMKTLIAAGISKKITDGLEEVGIENDEIYPALTVALNEALQAATSEESDSLYLEILNNNEFVQAVVDRTIQYATEDILLQLGIIKDRDAAVKECTDYIMNNAKLFYSYKYVIAGPVTGWSSSKINLYIAGKYTASLITEDYQAALDSMDLEAIIMKAAVRAVKDELEARYNEFEDCIREKSAAILEEALRKVGIEDPMIDSSSWEAMAQSLKAYLPTEEEREALAEQLDACARNSTADYWEKVFGLIGMEDTVIDDSSWEALGESLADSCQEAARKELEKHLDHFPKKY